MSDLTLQPELRRSVLAMGLARAFQTFARTISERAVAQRSALRRPNTACFAFNEFLGGIARLGGLAGYLL